MKRLLPLLLLAACSLPATAQIADLSAPIPLLRGTYSDLYHPILSHDGNRLLVSAADYSHLRLYDYELGTMVTVSDQPRSGYKATFSDDGTAVSYVSRTASGQSLQRYDIAARRTIDLPAVDRTATPASLSATAATSVYTDHDRLHIVSRGVDAVYSPVEAAAYLWPSLSPDGSRVMFVAAGKGVYITDLQGNIQSFAGNFEAPAWLGNDCIVAQRATDDGHQLRSSQIVIARADGSQMQEVTRPESMAMYPTASLSAGRIVYCTVDGYLYQINVTLK